MLVIISELFNLLYINYLPTTDAGNKPINIGILNYNDCNRTREPQFSRPSYLSSVLFVFGCWFTKFIAKYEWIIFHFTSWFLTGIIYHSFQDTTNQCHHLTTPIQQIHFGCQLSIDLLLDSLQFLLTVLSMKHGHKIHWFVQIHEEFGNKERVLLFGLELKL